VCEIHILRVKSHSTCGNCTLRVECNLVRVEITLVRVIITFVPVDPCMYKSLSYRNYTRECHIHRRTCQDDLNGVMISNADC
jgi:hypothetical protein